MARKCQRDLPARFKLQQISKAMNQENAAMAWVLLSITWMRFGLVETTFAIAEFLKKDLGSSLLSSRSEGMSVHLIDGA
jgi:hypothetical protein